MVKDPLADSSGAVTPRSILTREAVEWHPFAQLSGHQSVFLELLEVAVGDLEAGEHPGDYVGKELVGELDKRPGPFREQFEETVLPLEDERPSGFDSAFDVGYLPSVCREDEVDV